ncbi:high mobility group box domain-containing protein [Parasitella parasitica]|nr:high mobility group box domain-containing protein [Parasitella parasitica]
MAEEIKQRHKIDELKKRFRQVEGENDLLQEKLHRAQKSIKRLRLERSILLERIDKANRHHHKNYKQTEKNNTVTAVIKPPKKKKDPNAPKGPGNVFFLFCRQERDKVKEEFPEESIGDVTKLLGHKWKGLTKEEKLVYHDMFKREMDEYEEAMKTYKKSLISSPVSINNDITMQQQQQPPRDDYHNNNAFEKPVITNPPSAPYDHF